MRAKAASRETNVRVSPLCETEGRGEKKKNARVSPFGRRQDERKTVEAKKTREFPLFGRRHQEEKKKTREFSLVEGDRMRGKTITEKKMREFPLCGRRQKEKE